MRWIVGLDLRGLSQGAIHYARWLHEHAKAERLIGVHVIEALPDAARDIDLPIETVREWLLAAAEKEVARAGAREAFDDVDVERSTRAEEGLEAAVAGKKAHGLILGRKAPRGQDALVRLGRVARRMIRRASAPLVVVPPDLMAQDVGDGPVMVATDLSQAAAGALRFGDALARSLGRELVVAYGVRAPSLLDQYLPADAWEGVQRAVSEGGARSAQDWAAGLGVRARIHVVEGPLARGLAVAAVRERACLLVCGSRRLSALERLFSSSVGAEVAASAPLATAIVPPEWGAPD